MFDSYNAPKIYLAKANRGSSFVGLSMTDGQLVATFPMGYHLDYSDLQEVNDHIFDDIQILIGVINKNLSDGIMSEEENIDYYFPIYDYMYVIEYFFSHNYEFYKETEIKYDVRDSGKIFWSKTIKHTKATIINGEIFYLDTIRRHNSPKDDDLITNINRFCVYKALELLGPLYGGLRIDKPFDYVDKSTVDYWISFVQNKICQTNNDNKKKLFISMVAILNDQNNRQDENNFAFGTSEFHAVWEEMVDKIFGSKLSESEKKEFYPTAQWKINSQDPKDATYLRPDTIRFNDDKTEVYILDAKYYSYGDNLESNNARLLPGTADINKEFAYIAYAKKRFSKNNSITPNYFINTSAFVLPFDKSYYKTRNSLLRIGEAQCSWYDDDLKLYAILADTKDLMVSYLGNQKSNFAYINGLMKQ